MKKAFTSKKEIKKFKDDYSSSEIRTEVISNFFNLGKCEQSELNEFIKTIYYHLDISLLFLINQYAELALTEKFGKYDFTFEGNRKYKNWILEHEGLTFIAPAKREVVLTGDVLEQPDFYKKIVSFEKEFMQMVIDSIYQHGDELAPQIKGDLKSLEDKGILLDGKINFNPPASSSKIKIKF